MPFAYHLTDGTDPMTYAEIDVLAALARGIVEPYPVIVNIGADLGLSTITFLEARPDAVIYSCDSEPCERELENVRAAGLDATRVIRILGNSQETGLHFRSECDFLFIDGSHQYEGVKGDILAWLPHLKAGCVFAFHDYIVGEKPANNPAEVDQAVDEMIIGRYEEVARVDRLIAFRTPQSESLKYMAVGQAAIDGIMAGIASTPEGCCAGRRSCCGV